MTPAAAAYSKTGLRLFVAAQFVAYCGTWMQKAALGWFVWELTRSPAWVAAIALSELVALLWVGPFAGAVTDRNNPFKLLMVTLVGLLALSALLWGLTISGATSWVLVGWAVAYATVHGFNHPVRMLAIGSLAAENRMSQAIAMNSIAVNLARTAGPAIAGAIIVYSNTSLVFLLSAACYGTMIGAVVALRRYLDRASLAGKSATMGKSMAQGFHYMLRTPHIALVLFLATSFSLMVRPFAELFPAIAGEILNGGPDTLALLMSSQGIGATVGALLMLRHRNPQSIPVITQAAGLGIGIALSALVFTSSQWAAMLCIGAAGLFHVVTNIGMQSMVQLFSAPEMRGRVVALYGMIFRAGPALGAFTMGYVAGWIPLSWLISAGGMAFCVLLAGLWLTARQRFLPLVAASNQVA